MNSTYVITAAGGNPTAIRVLEHALPRAKYEELGKELMTETAEFGTEQCGFLIPSEKHFEMSGGEFCGNAARAAALLLSNLKNRIDVKFTMSGFPGTVSGEVNQTADKIFRVGCIFPDMPVKLTPKKVGEYEGVLVDLGGIVHFVIEDEFPNNYEEIHKAITKRLALTNRDAVGVVWYKKNGEVAVMHPVVWVRAIDTFFYETSCGSGTIALGLVTGAQHVTQPTGQSIEVILFGENLIVLKSDMEVIYEG